MWISTVAAGEFAVKQIFLRPPVAEFQDSSIQPHACHSRRGAPEPGKGYFDGSGRSASESIINDLKIIAQAAEEKVPFILTEDENTLVRLAAGLRAKGALGGRHIALERWLRA